MPQRLSAPRAVPRRCGRPWRWWRRWWPPAGSGSPHAGTVRRGLASPAIAALNPVNTTGHVGRGLGDRPVGARRRALDVIGLPQQRGEPPSRRADRRPGRFPVQCHYWKVCRAALAVWIVMVVSSGRYESTIRCRRCEIVGQNA